MYECSDTTVFPNYMYLSVRKPEIMTVNWPIIKIDCDMAVNQARSHTS